MVTNQHVYDNKALPELVDDIIKSNSMTTTIGKLFADGDYESNDIFRCLADNGIMPWIKVWKNAKVNWKQDIFLEICQLYPRKMICKDGRIAL